MFVCYEEMGNWRCDGGEERPEVRGASGGMGAGELMG